MRASGSTPDVHYLPWPRGPALTRFDIDRELTLQSRDIEKRLLAERTDIPQIAPTKVSFGSFRLFPTQFLLMEGDKPVPLGSRALGILIALLERPGEPVSKQDLMARVWPNVFVEPANLTVQMSALRRTLRDGRDGNRFIISIHGRGYQFVASVHATPHQDASAEAPRREAELGERPQIQSRSDLGAGSVLAFRRNRA